MQLLVKDRKFYKAALLIALPIVAQQIINIGVNLMDTVMLGSFGEIQLSGSSLANQYYFIFGVLCLGMGGGAAVITGQYWGAKDTDSINKTLSLILKICTIIAVIFSIITFLFPREIMSFYSKDQAVIESGAKYLKIMAFVFLFHGLSLTTVIVLRTVGVVRLALYSSCASFFINVFFNWVFIFGKLGAPRLEIAGAAIGTLLARICEFCITFGYLLFFDKQIRFSLKNLLDKIDIAFVKQFVHIAVPVIISDALLTLGNNALAMIMGRMGAEMVAANAITTVTVQISTVFIMGVSSASSVMSANTVGRGEYDKAQAQGVTFLTISAIIGLAGGIIIAVMRPIVINFYNITPQTKEIADQLMLMVAFIVVFQSIQSIMTKGVLRGGGDTKFLMAADVLFLWIASIPLGYMAGLVWGLQPFWVYFFLRIDFIIKSIWCVYRLKSRKWIKVVKGVEPDILG
ncbi:putative MATE family efflux protein [Anaerosolibacter carboniphilus]|uniref:Putative MATE family efflux protein n=1 Tax=Anaerosolibacter carboniphilus TaxID=1417629 RepID=A0A841KL93_9FIRM|nr:MATE family efflux transporter [Anaerosolibacter carboniphilus]MBB6214217.1 putative MATE family efflux protein [Anaerosolibacter carboniphilus]